MVQLGPAGRPRTRPFGTPDPTGRVAAIWLFALLVVLPGCPRQDLRTTEYSLTRGVGERSEHSVQLTTLYGTLATTLGGLTVEYRSDAQPCEVLRSGQSDFGVLRLESVLDCTDTESIDETRLALARDGLVALEPIELDGIEYLPIFTELLAHGTEPRLSDQLENLHQAIDASTPILLQNPESLSAAILAQGSQPAASSIVPTSG